MRIVFAVISGFLAMGCSWFANELFHSKFPVTMIIPLLMGIHLVLICISLAQSDGINEK